MSHATKIPYGREHLSERLSSFNRHRTTLCGKTQQMRKIKSIDITDSETETLFQ